jgi:hypothetical protein
MTLPEPKKAKSTLDEMDQLLRASRRALLIVLFMVLTLGATVLGRALWPESILATWPMRLPWLLPFFVVMLGVAGRLLMRGRTWDSKGLGMKKIQHDEFRQLNLARAQRAALITALVLQLPLGLLFAHLPGMRAVMAMGVTTITLAIATLIASFLFFDRE